MKKLGFLLLLFASRAYADDPPADPPPPPPPEPPVVKQDEEVIRRMNALEKRLKKVEEDLSQAQDDNKALGDQVQALLPLTTKFSGYADIGFFATTGNGAGTRSDLANLYFPQYSYVPGSWVFWGDPLATAINSRGDVADTGDSRAVVFNPIHSKGASTFLVNAVNFAIFAGLGENATLNTSIDFIPRSRDSSDPNGLFVGDYIDVKLAYAEWRPHIDKFALALQIGKFDSVLGYEYRSLESPDRLNVTPSLICRYTCGRPVGIKARAKFLEAENLILNVAVQNGSTFSEGFPFSDETDQNQWKTVAGRLSYKIAGKLELGASGAFGAQDDQTSDSIYQWHWGFDAHLEVGDFEATAEYVHGKAKGSTSDPTTANPMPAPCDLAPCIDYTGAYGLFGYRVTNTIVPFARVDWRDALHESGASFVYISKVLRATVGARFEIGTHLIVKAEATTVRELNPGIPQIPDDIVTTSVVVKY